MWLPWNARAALTIERASAVRQNIVASVDLTGVSLAFFLVIENTNRDISTLIMG